MEKNIIYSNMGYNKYMTENVEPNKYFYVRGRIFQKRSKYCKVEDCFKISSYGIDKIERCLNHRLKDMTNIRRKHILYKIHDISHGKNTKCKLCKKPNKYCNENNCYTSASFNFKIDDRPIKCKKHKENNMINVKRKYIVNNDNNSKITYKKGYICENNKKGGSIKNNKKVKIIKKVKILMKKIILMKNIYMIQLLNLLKMNLNKFMQMMMMNILL